MQIASKNVKGSLISFSSKTKKENVVQNTNNFNKTVFGIVTLILDMFDI
jgi:hypothetical protein